MAIKIGDLLIQRGLISKDQLERALVEQRRSATRLGVSLVRLGYIDEDTLTAVLSEQLGIAAAPPGALDDIPPEVIDRVPSRIATEHHLIPIRVDGRMVHLCMADPQNLGRLDDLAFALGCRIRPYLATEMQIDRALARYYATGPDVWEEALRATGEMMAFKSGAFQLPHAPDALPVVEAMVESDGEADLTEANRPPAGDDDPWAPVVATPEDPYEALASVTSREDLVAAVDAYFARHFANHCLLEISSKGARCLRLSLAGVTVTMPPAARRIPIEDALWVRELLRKPRVVVAEEVTDLHLRVLLDHLGLRFDQVSLVPIFDYGRLRFVLIGQGLAVAQIKELHRELKPYLATVSAALRMVALREHIRAQGRRPIAPADGGHELAVSPMSAR